MSCDKIYKELNEVRKKNDELLKDLNNEREKNKQLLKEVNQGRKKIEELNNKVKLYENSSNENSAKIKDYINTSNEYINKIKELQRLLNNKNIELKDLRSKLPDSKPSVKKGEKIIIVNFVSISQEIQFPLACKNTDTIARLEAKFYNEYPKYKEYNTYLTVNGNNIKRFKSLDENGIKNGNSIIVNISDKNN